MRIPRPSLQTKETANKPQVSILQLHSLPTLWRAKHALVTAFSSDSHADTADYRPLHFLSMSSCFRLGALKSHQYGTSSYTCPGAGGCRIVMTRSDFQRSALDASDSSREAGWLGCWKSSIKSQHQVKCWKMRTRSCLGTPWLCLSCRAVPTKPGSQTGLSLGLHTNTNDNTNTNSQIHAQCTYKHQGRDTKYTHTHQEQAEHTEQTEHTHTHTSTNSPACIVPTSGDPRYVPGPGRQEWVKGDSNRQA